MPKITFVGKIPVEDEKIRQNRENTKRLNLPKVELGCTKRDGRLAVVGGGPSVLSHLDKIRECSEVWAVNGACGLLRAHGIDSWLFAVDPHPIVAKWAVGASKALMCDRMDPSVWEALKDAKVLTYTVVNDDPAGVHSGSSSASVAFHLGVECGFACIDFFGCESSFEETTHAYQNERREELLWVECGGREYKTAPDFYMQAQEMAAIIRAFQNNFRHFGGGLLEAMIQDPEHEVAYVSQALMAQLQPV